MAAQAFFPLSKRHGDMLVLGLDLSLAVPCSPLDFPAIKSSISRQLNINIHLMRANG